MFTRSHIKGWLVYVRWREGYLGTNGMEVLECIMLLGSLEEFITVWRKSNVSVAFRLPVLCVWLGNFRADEYERRGDHIWVFRLHYCQFSAVISIKTWSQCVCDNCHGQRMSVVGWDIANHMKVFTTPKRSTWSYVWEQVVCGRHRQAIFIRQ
jgi:hypothetical protein